MANNSPGGVKSFVNEAVVQPVRDEFQKAVEAGVQSVAGTGQMNQNPQQAQADAQKKEEDRQKGIRNIKQFLQTANAQAQRYKQVEMQKEQQKKQAESQQEQEKKQIHQFKVEERRQQLTDVQTKQRQVEIKKGGF